MNYQSQKSTLRYKIQYFSMQRVVQSAMNDIRPLVTTKVNIFIGAKKLLEISRMTTGFVILRHLILKEICITSRSQIDQFTSLLLALFLSSHFS